MNIIRRKLLAGLLCLFCISAFTQTPPCRQWYYRKDNHGNEVKDNCKEAWQVNANGQKHGKYIAYYENGNPVLSAMYSNGALNGYAKAFDSDGVAILAEGNYVNGNKVGIWYYPKIKLTSNYDLHKNTLKWNDLILESTNKNGVLNGEVVLQFAFAQSYEGYSINITVNLEDEYTKSSDRHYGWDDNYSFDRSYFNLKGTELFGIIKILESERISNSYIVFKFANGKLTPYENKIYDGNKRFHKSINLLDEVSKIAENYKSKND